MFSKLVMVVVKIQESSVGEEEFTSKWSLYMVLVSKKQISTKQINKKNLPKSY
jgi:hypothetical protein